jgi:hypothetical protein
MRNDEKEFIASIGSVAFGIGAEYVTIEALSQILPKPRTAIGSVAQFVGMLGIVWVVGVETQKKTEKIISEVIL